MKKNIILLITILNFSLASNAQSASLEATDMKNFQGFWKGALTYLDYSSGKPYTMPAQTEMKPIAGQLSLTVRMIYPDEPKANTFDTLHISKDGKKIDAAVVISKRKLKDGSLEIITEEQGKDGNDNQKAILRKTYTVSETVLRIRKDVQFEGTTQWIKRHEYVYSK
jgi:hypothetical protein